MLGQSVNYMPADALLCALWWTRWHSGMTGCEPAYARLYVVGVWGAC